MDSCLVNVPIGRVVHHHVNGQLFYDEELSSVVITQQECYGINEMTQGLGDGDLVPIDKDDPPAPSATTKAEHTPTASEAAPTTSAHSTKTSRPKSQKTASPEPPTTTHKASDTDIKRPTDQDWLLATCFSDSHDGAVYSHKIVQDNIDWIVANVEKVPRNPGKGNCTRLACHRNSAIFFCNDVGYVPHTRPYMLTFLFFRMETSTATWRTPTRSSTGPGRLSTLAVSNSTGNPSLAMVTST